MADKKISALTGATTPLAGTEVLPIVQGGSTVKVSVANLTAGRTVSASALGVGTASPLTAINLEGGSFLLRGGVMDIGPTAGADGAGRISTARGGDGVSGILMFSTQNPSAAIVEAMRIDGSGNITTKIGNLVIGTAGKGIDFSANTHAAGMTSELLDWYEEGTWTPTYTGWSTNPILVSATYTRIGRIVHLNAIFFGGTTVGGAAIGGLPFSSGGTVGGAAVSAFTAANPSTQLSGVIMDYATTITNINAVTIGGNYWTLSTSYVVD